MYHSLIFEKLDNSNIHVNTWDNWHLIPVARPIVAQPTAMYKYVDIPGADGQLDLTDYLIGRPVYSNRTGTFEFYVVNGPEFYSPYERTTKDGVKQYANTNYGDWPSRRAAIASFLDGSKMKMYLEDERNYYYIGRFMFRDWKPGAVNSTVSIEYTLDPYRYLVNGGKAGL